jgi:hypothetical protein
MSIPWKMHVLRVDLRRTDIAIRHVRAHDQLRSRERVSDMAARLTAAGTQVIAAVNSDFFELASGENENNQVIDGEWWKGLKVTDSPFDAFDNPHAQLAVDARGRAVIDRFVLDGVRPGGVDDAIPGELVVEWDVQKWGAHRCISARWEQGAAAVVTRKDC